MQALIDLILRNLKELWPFRLVHSWSHGLLVRGGKVKQELKPGIHFRWPFLDQVLSTPNTEQATNLETAAITTSDGHAIAVSANLAWRCTSVRDMWLNVWSVYETLPKLTLGHVATHCAKLTWHDLRYNRAQLETDLLAAINAHVNGWGLVVDRVQLTDLVQVRPYRHYLDGATYKA